MDKLDYIKIKKSKDFIKICEKREATTANECNLQRITYQKETDNCVTIQFIGKNFKPFHRRGNTNAKQIQEKTFTSLIIRRMNIKYT